MADPDGTVPAQAAEDDEPCPVRGGGQGAARPDGKWAVEDHLEDRLEDRLEDHLEDHLEDRRAAVRLRR